MKAMQKFTEINALGKFHAIELAPPDDGFAAAGSEAAERDATSSSGGHSLLGAPLDTSFRAVAG
jgi:hypothetical protein